MKKKVMIIVPKMSDGGTERVASNLSINLDKCFQQFIVIFFNDKQDYQFDGEIINLNLKSGDCFLSKLYNSFNRFWQIRKLKKSLCIDTAISFGENPNILNILTKGKETVITTIHFCKSFEKKNFYYRIYDFLIKHLYNRANYNIGVSKLIKHDLETNYQLKPNKVKAIYNFYNIARIQEMAEECLEAEYVGIFNEHTIVNVGRLDQQKGHWHLFKAFKIVLEEYPDARLVLLGDGILKDKLLQLADDLHIHKSIFILGFHKNPFKFIKKSSCFVLSSLYEGFPNVLVEALACGCCIISADCKSGPRELLAPDTNILYETKDIETAQYGLLFPAVSREENWNAKDIDVVEEKIAESVIKLWSNLGLQNEYRQKAVKRAMNFDAQVIVKQYENLI